MWLSLDLAFCLLCTHAILIVTEAATALNYRRKTEVGNYTCLEIDLIANLSAGSAMQCISYCDNLRGTCRSVFYHKGKSKCHICTETYVAESTLPLLPGSVYYEVGMYLIIEAIIFIVILGRQERPLIDIGYHHVKYVFYSLSI